MHLKLCFKSFLVLAAAVNAIFVLNLSLAAAPQTVEQDAAADLFTRLQHHQSCRFGGRFIQTKQLAGVTQALSASGEFLYDCQRGVIWATAEPELDILVLTKVRETSNIKPQAYRYADGQLQRLKNRQSQVLSELIFSLMAADRAALSTLFAVENSDTGGALLHPKKRGLKRAITQVRVGLHDRPQVNGSQVNGSALMQIEILDRNQQITRIDSFKDKTFTELDNRICREHGFVATVCDIVFSPAPIMKPIESAPQRTPQTQPEAQAQPKPVN